MLDLIFNLRFEMTLPQLEKAAYFYASTLKDYSLTPSIHTMSIKIISNIVEAIGTHQDNIHGIYL